MPTIYCNFSSSMGVIHNYVTGEKIIDLPSHEHYFNYERCNILGLEDFKKNIAELNYSIFKNKGKTTADNNNNNTNNNHLDNKPCLIKTKDGDIVLFIPYTKPIFISKVTTTEGIDDD